MKTTRNQSQSGTKQKPKNDMQENDKNPALRELFESQLQDIYWAEKALVKAIPKMVKKTTYAELADALQNHLSETEEQVKRLEDVFASIDAKVKAKRCESMVGLISEAEQLMKESEGGVVRDVAIILAAQKIEHYEISTYGTLSSLAKTLGFDDASDLLEETLEEEKNADKTLNDIAISCVNEEAVESAE